MYRLNKETDTFEPYFHHKEYRFIERIIWDEIHHCYWLGTWEKGIVCFDPEADDAERRYISQPLPVDIAHQATGDVFHMVQDDVFHYLWVTTDKDLLFLESQNRESWNKWILLFFFRQETRCFMRYTRIGKDSYGFQHSIWRVLWWRSVTMELINIRWLRCGIE